ncbi:MAG: hypothetical protein ABJI96_20795 [Paracoccaceae bacterium]
MSEKHRFAPKNRPDLKVIERFVGELYALADQIFDPIDDAKVIDSNRVKWAHQRLDRLIAAQQPRVSPVTRLRRYRWMVNVLYDLIAYAEKEQLALVQERYDGAKKYPNRAMGIENEDYE